MNDTERAPAVSNRGTLNFWYPVLPLAIFLLAIIAYLQTSGSILEEWLEPGNYSDGLLALAMTALLIHGNRRHLPFATATGYRVAVLASFAFGSLWLLGKLGEIQIVQQFALICLLNTIFLAIYGWQTYRQAFLFPLATLLLVAPIWNFLAPPLQDLSTSVSCVVVSHLGIPVLRENHTIVVPGGAFVVEEGCAGLGFLLASVLLSLYVIYLNSLKARDAILFLLFAMVIAIASNWLRIVIIVIIGNMTHMQNPLVTNHLVFGWILFSIAILPLVFVGHRLATDISTESAPTITTRDHHLAVPIVLMLLFPGAAFLINHLSADANYDIRPPATLGDYSINPSITSNWSPRYIGYDSKYDVTYQNINRKFEVVTVNFRNEQQGKELIFYKNKPYHPGTVRLLASGTKANYNYVILSDEHAQKRLVAYWYRVCGRNTTSRYTAKALEIYCKLTGRGGSSAIFVSRQYDTGQQPFDESVTAFIQTLKAALAKH